ncbi:MAG: type II toxin-antitoxin system Phd/YefM family antitoxin [Spirochaetaceae bacterium]|jgi:prevent-host-death family protein|nr:type II toxin-antitoxin system Phd/YefM family antitoxin [Spirochaetaceae bacterium]
MNLMQDVRPISYIKNHTAGVMDYINEHKSPVIITQHGEARGVLLDSASYESMINALTLMKLLQKGETDIKAGRLHEQNEVFSSIRNKYRA